MLIAATCAMSGWWVARALVGSRPGTIAVSTIPLDATVLVDNVKMSDGSPLMFDRAPGPYTVSVTREGYSRSDYNVDVRPGQVTTLNVKLEPSPDTGFELTSDPPGRLVWLDGVPLRTFSGEQARTNFRASRIAPGHHRLEVRGAFFKDWHFEFEIDPGAIRRIHATLIPQPMP